jgi:murein DD-endopeptidase MepM/ murein hydrolase activator NlpD
MKLTKPLPAIAFSLVFWPVLVLFILAFNSTNSLFNDPTGSSFGEGTAIASISPSPQTGMDLQQPDVVLPVVAAVPLPEYKTIRGELRAGEGLDDSLKRMQLSADIRRELIRALSGTLDFRRLRPHDSYTVTLDEQDELVRYDYQSGPLQSYTVVKTEDGFRAEKVAIPLELRVERLTGVVRSSLFATFTELGEQPKLIHGFANIFASKIDFNTECRQNDRVDIVYEKYFKDGEFVGYGKILVARYEQADTSWEGYYYESRETPAGYYDNSGEELGTSFLRSPIPFGRVTSGFSYRRKHPISKVVRPHLGVDLAAPAGTPVLAASEGKIVYLGWKGGFGKAVVIKHANGYRTYYGHLSRYGKGLKVGSRVEQKDVIGYVGSTGQSTGPHLDYRISVNGTFKNPFSLKFKPKYTIMGAEVENFREAATGLAGLMSGPDDGAILQVKNIVFSQDNKIFFL